MRELILGGVKSGKSRYAEQQATASGLAVCYVATAEIRDAGMQARIAEHRARRPADWQLVEAPYELAAAIDKHARADRCLLVDCLTLWLTQLLCRDDEAAFLNQRDRLLASLTSCAGRVLLVSNEVGGGVMPDNALARRFADEAGSLHQALAECCERVTFVTAGLPYYLKNNQ